MASRSNQKYVSSGSNNLSSVRIGDLNHVRRLAKQRRTNRRTRVILIIILVLVIVLGGGGVALYFSPLFKIDTVQVNGSEHLTTADMQGLLSLSSGATLLNVDTNAIKNSVERDAWVEEASVERTFPSTLTIDITERQIAAVVEIISDTQGNVQDWAIASDGMWLMSIPDRDSDLGRSISQAIYDDVDNSLLITDVAFGLVPEVGTYCTDDNVNNALSIINGLSPTLSDEISEVSATDAESTLLILKSGVEISFGSAEDIEDKEKVCLEILDAHPDSVAYINVRVPSRPTWRAISE
ncbi:MAG: FtsQ-type POTRA domain-containing protein [Eggerthellaceae bacterium]|nr:FtsQ-type POTRA domain-containing protein [Eggerthellaceae bacterium]